MEEISDPSFFPLSPFCSDDIAQSGYFYLLLLLLLLPLHGHEKKKVEDKRDQNIGGVQHETAGLLSRLLEEEGDGHWSGSIPEG